ncbi:MAG: hypothetical protein B7O98_02635 [Zestosphaera tikiterensis]|uniref:Uncharacterized protein n=1 Tax=Zestosphaera tikiterensis TaxID=1973259 RepID=A0A2R7Y734_9CREN|nr:MAG: hypothetical protein B7O98_02635 [Zestosphaera tikiterensis]
MSLPPIDLSLFDKKVRGKIRLAVSMGQLLHFIYLAVKNFPDRVAKYSSFLQLINDKEFAAEVLRKESRFGGRGGSPLKYLGLVNAIAQRGYSRLLELADIVWDLTVYHSRIDPKTLFNNIVGLASEKHYSLLDEMRIHGKATYKRSPFIMNIRHYNYITVEVEYGGRSEALAKTLIYIGSLADTNESLGLFARFSVRSIDAEHVVRKQEEGCAHRLIKTFRLYPTVLRMQRLSYKRVYPVQNQRSEVLNMLSELFIDDKKFASLINMDVPANILAMAPSISLGGGLCFATAFRGELLDFLGIEKEAKIKVADTVIKAIPSYYSVLDCQKSPGDYVFMVFHPFTAPKVGLVVATYSTNVLGSLKPKRRNVSSLDNLFPKVEEVAKLPSET